MEHTVLSKVGVYQPVHPERTKIREGKALPPHPRPMHIFMQTSDVHCDVIFSGNHSPTPKLSLSLSLSSLPALELGLQPPGFPWLQAFTHHIMVQCGPSACGQQNLPSLYNCASQLYVSLLSIVCRGPRQTQCTTLTQLLGFCGKTKHLQGFGIKPFQKAEQVQRLRPRILESVCMAPNLSLPWTS